MQVATPPWIHQTPEERIHSVHEWQRFYGMEPRSDSKLTRMFAEGSVNMYPDQVARELMATDFIYKFTLYGEMLEEFLRKVAARMKEQHDMTWTATWQIVRFYGPIALKLICLMQASQTIPQRMRMPDDREVISSAPDEPVYPRIPSTLSIVTDGSESSR
jgi:hypothetical protein